MEPAERSAQSRAPPDLPAACGAEQAAKRTRAETGAVVLTPHEAPTSLHRQEINGTRSNVGGRSDRFRRKARGATLVGAVQQLDDRVALLTDDVARLEALFGEEYSDVVIRRFDW